MRSLIVSLLILAASCGLVITGTSQSAKPAAHAFHPSRDAWKFADKLLSTMSVEEKAGQLFQIGINARFTNQDSDYFRDLKRQVAENRVGGIILYGAPIYESVHLVNRMQEHAKIPLLISVDAETGVGMRFGDAINFPWNMAVAATGDPEYARKIGVITGREARAMGILQVLAPVLDVNNNADNPIINVRSFGEDPQVVAKYGIAFIEGLQSQRVIATAKHFPGHGDTNIDSHSGLPVIDHSRESLEKTELVPFRQAVLNRVSSIMIAHISLPQIDPTEIKPIDPGAQTDISGQKATLPATLSGIVQTQILRNEMNFDGLIITDAVDMQGLTRYFTQEEAGVRAILAGADILLKPADTDAMLRGVINAVRSGRISESRLNGSVRRILAWKYELGLYKNKITPLDQLDRIVSTKDVGALANEIGEKAMTLVRNDVGAIPIDHSKKVCILAISNGIDSDTTIGTLISELRSAGIDFTAALIQANSTPEQIGKARETANGSDIVVAALYGRVRSGEKNSVGLPEPGVTLLKDLLTANKNVIGVSYGNPYILSAFPQMKTYLVAYGDMPSLQRASIRAMFGMQMITGRLPISLPGLYPRGTGIQLQKK